MPVTPPRPQPAPAEKQPAGPPPLPKQVPPGVMPSPATQALVKAAAAGNITDVAAWLAAGADANGLAQVEVQVATGRRVRQMIGGSEYEVEEQIPVTLWTTPLNAAVYQTENKYGGRGRIVAALLQAGANPMKADAVGNVPLRLISHAGTGAKRWGITLSAGEWVDLRGALCAAVATFDAPGIGESDDVLAYRELQAIGRGDASVLARAPRDRRFSEALRECNIYDIHAAAMGGLLGMVKSVLEYADWAGNGVLVWAARRRDAAGVRLVLERAYGGSYARYLEFTNRDTKDSLPLALDLAIRNKDAESVRALLAFGLPLSAAADYNARHTMDGRLLPHPMHAAVLTADAGILAALSDATDAASEIDAQSDRGYTALMIAGAKGHTALATMLLSRGADPARTDALGMTYEEWRREPALHLVERLMTLLTLQRQGLTPTPQWRSTRDERARAAARMVAYGALATSDLAEWVNSGGYLVHPSQEAIERAAAAAGSASALEAELLKDTQIPSGAARRCIAQVQCLSRTSGEPSISGICGPGSSVPRR